MERNKTEFNEAGLEERVVLENEQNDSVLSNDVGDFCLETNSNYEITETKIKKKKDVARKISLRVVSTFLFMCVATAVIQTSIHIPLFSDLFHSSPSSSEPAVVEKPYVSSIVFDNKTDSEYRYLNFRAVLDSGFSNYDLIYYDLKNVTDDIVIPWTSVPKVYIETSFFGYKVLKTAPAKKYQVRVWCSTFDPTNLKYTDTMMADETLIYLLYTEEINF